MATIRLLLNGHPIYFERHPETKGLTFIWPGVRQEHLLVLEDHSTRDRNLWLARAFQYCSKGSTAQVAVDDLVRRLQQQQARITAFLAGVPYQP